MSDATPAPLTLKPAFDDAALQAAVDKALSELPANRQGAFVAHADASGAVVSVVERVGGHFIFKAGAIYPWGGKLEAAAEVVASW